MRVTQGMLTNTMLRNLSSSNSQLSKYMDQLSTGKKITKPSDDPVIAMNGMGYRSEVVKVEQFQRNTNEAYNWFDNTDSALDQSTQGLNRIRDLALQASNDTYDDGQREYIAMEIQQIKQDLIDIANTKVNDKYIFNGTNTATKPFDENGVTTTLTGDIQAVKMEVISNTQLQVNVNPLKAFGEVVDVVDEDGNPTGDKTAKLFSDIDKLIAALNSDDRDQIEASISDLDDNTDNVINARADLGARMNRLDLISNRLEEQEITAIKTMSNNEDIDYEKVITELITQESIHRAALSTSARIIQPSLIDFLR